VIEFLKRLDKILLEEIDKKVFYEKDKVFYEEYDKNVNTFYSVNEENLKKIFFVLKKDFNKVQKKQLSIFLKISSDFEFLRPFFKKSKLIENEQDYIFCIISILILKAFSQKNVKNKNNNLELKNHSYFILNYLNESFISFLEWVDIKNDFYQFDSKKDFKEFFHQLVIILINNNLIETIKLNFKKNHTESL